MVFTQDISQLDQVMEEDRRRRLLWAPLAILESGHATFLDELRALETLLNTLLTRRRARCGAGHVDRFRRMIKFMELSTFPHIRLEEKVVFPHLRRLAPELGRTLRQLQREHRLYEAEMGKLRRRFRDLERSPERASAVHRFCDQGLDIITLLRAHIATESHLVTTIPAALRVRAGETAGAFR